MAEEKKPKNTAKPEEEESPTLTVAPINFANYLPEGLAESDLVELGGLRPMCLANTIAMAPVAGWALDIRDMPPRRSLDRERRKNNEKDPWCGVFIELTAPTKAMRGGEIVDVKAGEEVFLPMNAGLNGNRDLILRAIHPEVLSWIMVYIDPDHPMISFEDERNDMPNYRVKEAHGHTRRREHKHRISYSAHNPRMLEGADNKALPVSSTSTNVSTTAPAQPGQVIDRNGKPVERVVG